MTGTEQFGLDLRAHDLPPAWDGAPIEWGPWEPLPDAFICPPPKLDGCEHCHSTATPVRAHGTRTIGYGDNVVTIRTGRLHPRHLHAPLIAVRCSGCGHDTVWDAVTDQWWDLDDSDYQDGGSWE